MKAACSGPVGKGITIVIEVKGKFNTALCYTPALDGKAEEQIRLVCDEEAFRDSKIRIMPDVHAGKGCTIGTTMTITDKVVPGMVGVDIGCGMETVRIAQREIDSEKLDALIRSAIPCGREVRMASHEYCSSIDLSALRCAPYVNLERAKKSIGTLGGGNHFIEADRSDTGDIYIVVHSGSRHLGVEVADYYQEQGRMALWGGARYQIGQLIETLKSEGRFQEIQPAVTALKKEHKISIPKDLAYVEGKLFEDYIHDMRIVQRFAVLNRKAMMDVILSGMGFTKAAEFTTIHNYRHGRDGPAQRLGFCQEGRKAAHSHQYAGRQPYLYRKRKPGVELLRPSWGRAAHEPESGVFHAFHGTVPEGNEGHLLHLCCSGYVG